MRDNRRPFKPQTVYQSPWCIYLFSPQWKTAFQGHDGEVRVKNSLWAASLPKHQYQYSSLKRWQCVWAVSHTLPPLQTHTNTHTCLHTDKTSTTAAPNVFAHWRRLTALPHWMTWTIYSDATLNPRGNLDWDWKKRKIRHDLKALREGWRRRRGAKPEAERQGDIWACHSTLQCHYKLDNH